MAATEQASALALLLDNGLREEDPNQMWVSAIRWACASPVIIEPVAQAVREGMPRLTWAVPAELNGSGVPALVDLVAEIARSQSAPADVIEAAQIELDQ